jgi:glycerol-3-phosphate acyltransferase PlsY
MDFVQSPEILTVLATLSAYLLGSLSFAVVVSKLMGLSDPRSYGSKNPGATNVLRSGNKVAAALTLLLDGLKGWLPVFAVRYWGEQWGLGEGAAALVALGAFLGHLFPVFFGFKGGKGVATFLGVILGLAPILGLMALVTWLLVAYASRYSSLAAMVCAVLAPLYYGLFDGVLWYTSRWIVLVQLLMAALLLYRHRDNILNLLAGKESKIGQKKKS